MQRRTISLAALIRGGRQRVAQAERLLVGMHWYALRLGLGLGLGLGCGSRAARPCILQAMHPAGDHCMHPGAQAMGGHYEHIGCVLRTAHS